MITKNFGFGQSLINKFIWKGKQKYSQLRSHLGGGYFVWKLNDHVRFVSYKGDEFSHVLYVCRGHEKIELNWCKRWLQLDQSCKEVIDCGANIGYFSAILAQQCTIKTILAIEGNHNTFKLCQKTFDILNLANIQLIEAVLSENVTDDYTIPDRPGSEPWQNAVKVSSGSSSTYTTTLDKIVSETNISPDLIKIDCEGFETLILKGSSNILSFMRPAFMIECNDPALRQAGTNRKELFDFLRSYDYKLFHLASFKDFYPLGVEIDDNFPASEFNFAAIPNNVASLTRWNQSIVPLV